VSIDNGARSSEPPLDLDAAEKLDQRIQRIADTAARNLDTLAELLSEAQAGHIHEVLGFPSWTEYVAARLKPITKSLGREELRALITELYDAGMSVRAIAEAVDTSKSTVSRQVSQSGTGDEAAQTAETTGLDGKTYARHHNGGARGQQSARVRLSRARSAIENIPLDGDAADIKTRICSLIDELLASIEPAAVSN
jgi:hypothetical protein